MKLLSVTIEIQATEQYFPMTMCIDMLCCAVRGSTCTWFYMYNETFESVDEILNCDHSNESYWAILSFGAVYLSWLETLRIRS